jgi:hypothetical protein
MKKKTRNLKKVSKKDMKAIKGGALEAPRKRPGRIKYSNLTFG